MHGVFTPHQFLVDLLFVNPVTIIGEHCWKNKYISTGLLQKFPTTLEYNVSQVMQHHSSRVKMIFVGVGDRPIIDHLTGLAWLAQSGAPERTSNW